MQPTNNLRFVEREITIHHADCLYASLKTVRVLQQWWACDPNSLMDWTLKANGEWRDVPLEIEGD